MKTNFVSVLLLSLLALSHVSAFVALDGTPKMADFADFMEGVHEYRAPLPNTIPEVHAQIKALFNGFGVPSENADPQFYLSVFRLLPLGSQTQVENLAKSLFFNYQTLQDRLKFLIAKEGKSPARPTGFVSSQRLPAGVLRFDELEPSQWRDLSAAIKQAEADDEKRSALREKRLATLTGAAREAYIRQNAKFDADQQHQFKSLEARFSRLPSPQKDIEWTNLSREARLRYKVDQIVSLNREKNRPFYLLRGGAALRYLTPANKEYLRRVYPNERIL